MILFVPATGSLMETSANLRLSLANFVLASSRSLHKESVRIRNKLLGHPRSPMVNDNKTIINFPDLDFFSSRMPPVLRSRLPTGMRIRRQDVCQSLHVKSGGLPRRVRVHFGIDQWRRMSWIRIINRGALPRLRSLWRRTDLRDLWILLCWWHLHPSGKAVRPCQRLFGWVRREPLSRDYSSKR